MREAGQAVMPYAASGGPLRRDPVREQSRADWAITAFADVALTCCAPTGEAIARGTSWPGSS